MTFANVITTDRSELNPFNALAINAGTLCTVMSVGLVDFSFIAMRIELLIDGRIVIYATSSRDVWTRVWEEIK